MSARCPWAGCDFPSRDEHYQVSVHWTNGYGWAVSLLWHHGGIGTDGTSSRRYFGGGDDAYLKAFGYARWKKARLKDSMDRPFASLRLPAIRPEVGPQP